MENQIYSVDVTPTGVAVDIQGFGVWGLSHADVSVLRDGGHLVRGTWPEHEAWCNDSWMDYADESVANLLDAAQERARVEAIRDQLEKIPGCAREVWGGWVWVVGCNEQQWSKRPTRAECEQVVHEVVDMYGVDDALDLFVDEEA